MIKHIVFFRLKEMSNPEDKENLLRELKNRIELLKNEINEIISIEAGINFSDRDVAYDLALISDFEDEDSLEKYRVHPAHQKLVAFLDNIKKDIAVVDYFY